MTLADRHQSRWVAETQGEGDASGGGDGCSTGGGGNGGGGGGDGCSAGGGGDGCGAVGREHTVDQQYTWTYKAAAPHIIPYFSALIRTTKITSKTSSIPAD